MSETTHECAVCGKACGLTVNYRWQDVSYDYCLVCAPGAIEKLRDAVEGVQ